MDEIDELLDDLIDKNESIILKSIRRLENRIITLTASIDVNKDGSIVGPSRSLAQSRAVLKEASIAFDDIYGTAVTQTIASYDALDTFVQSQYNVVYQGVTVNTLTSMTAIQKSFADSLAGSTKDRLNASFIDHVINGRNKDSLVNSIRGILSGRVDKAGRPFSMHARTLAQDGLMQYFSTANFSTAKSVGVKKFKYSGTLIKTSRPWCVEHLNHIYTEDQIEKFDNDTWKGKKDGSTMINRGGYWCRHYWVPEID